MALFNRSEHGYSKIEKEDPEETKHRRAQFLIYKAMQKADIGRKRASWLRVRMVKLKMKIGKSLRILKRGFSATAFSAKLHFCNQFYCVLRSCKHLLHAKQGSIVKTLPPMF